MRTIVADAGPLIHLWEARLLPLLQACGRVGVPPLVKDEVCANTGIGTRWPAWIKVEPLASADARTAAAWVKLGDLHGGEAEAVVLAQTVAADWFLTDDAGARLVAVSLGLEAHGSLGIVLWNVAHRLINRDQGLAALEGLRGSSLWISDRILREAETAVREMCMRA